ncbi:hypothetical protein Q5P01_025165 [Channa striata]|uniref:Ig-like domain-containing protein n=1 Tax=Channa striata TaxID=64152 RepID=A0AA88LHZ8_CHASR|nr:hypothetical protein Q5P01_025165 [Channa striata]
MDRLHIFIILLIGVVATSQVQMSGSVLEWKVTPGRNITLFCDCRTSVGEYVVWYRNCSHLNQPSLVMGTRYPHEKLLNSDYNYANNDILNPFPRFHLEKNQSSQSYDLLILNVTDSDEGLYYCGTQQFHTGKYLSAMAMSQPGSSFCFFPAVPPPHHNNDPHECGLCWSVCPAFAVFSSLFSSLLVYHLCKRTAEAPQVDEKRCETRGHTRENPDEDVCYTALKIHRASQKSKETRNQSFSTRCDGNNMVIYSSIKNN